MQMVNEINVMLHSKDMAEYNDQTIEIYNFRVNYVIYRNNGTWRDDVTSQELRPEIFQVIQTEEGLYKILRILKVEARD